MAALPPLDALHAFEAIARLGSVTKAADSLALTQSAVSHRLKALEERVGAPLFRRQGRRLVLTEKGAAFLPPVREAFELLRQASDKLQRKEGNRLVVTATSSLATAWLMRRLSRFYARHPEIELAITTSEKLIDFNNEDVDAGLRFGPGSWAGLTATRFLTETLSPVCSPKLLDSPRPLRHPSDLKHHTLLHDEMREDWRLWLTAAGVRDEVDWTRGPYFSHSVLAIHAAIEGMGVALGRLPLVQGALGRGELVQPFAEAVPVSWAHYLVHLPERKSDKRIEALRLWLIEEGQKTD
ncbi:MAG: transcriptional regulator GcvA [Alphaproteobacteria bacterium]|nr:transcriptional regulator GcvA [Alphaproteobacteria bacterium]